MKVTIVSDKFEQISNQERERIVKYCIEDLCKEVKGKIEINAKSVSEWKGLTKPVNTNTTKTFVESKWDNWYVKGLSDFIKVPNLSPMYDDKFLTNGLIQNAAKLVDDYINQLGIKGLKKHEFKPKDKPPMIIYVVEPQGSSQKNLMLYGHLDKQPWMLPWKQGLGPTKPVLAGDFLYGRGGADDGYSPFSCMLAIASLQAQNSPHPRCVLVLETEEESGSPNLLELLKLSKDVIGNPDVMICMDSGAFDYKRLWLTSSLRGVVSLDLTVQGATQCYHSGEVGGIVPETFRVLRSLLDRLDDSKTGKICKELQVETPDFKLDEAKQISNLSGDQMWQKYSLCKGVQAMDQENLIEMYLNNVWRANLSITGADGLPEIEKAGNIVRSKTSVRLSMRLSPKHDPAEVMEILKQKLTKNVPHNCKVTLTNEGQGKGWCKKQYEPWLDNAILQAGQEFFDGKATGSYGMGGSIPFLAELEQMYPQTQIVALGLLGPQSNAHAPDECINLAYAKKLTCSLAHIISAVGSQ